MPSHSGSNTLHSHLRFPIWCLDNFIRLFIVKTGFKSVAFQREVTYPICSSVLQISASDSNSCISFDDREAVLIEVLLMHSWAWLITHNQLILKHQDAKHCLKSLLLDGKLSIAWRGENSWVSNENQIQHFKAFPPVAQKITSAFYFFLTKLNKYKPS